MVGVLKLQRLKGWMLYTMKLVSTAGLRGAGLRPAECHQESQTTCVGRKRISEVLMRTALFCLFWAVLTSSTVFAQQEPPRPQSPPAAPPAETKTAETKPKPPEPEGPPARPGPSVDPARLAAPTPADVTRCTGPLDDKSSA